MSADMEDRIKKKNKTCKQALGYFKNNDDHMTIDDVENRQSQREPSWIINTYN